MRVQVHYHPSQGRTLAISPSPRIERLRQARRELRRGASAVLDATQDLAGRDYEVAARLIDSADLLLRRFMNLERRIR